MVHPILDKYYERDPYHVRSSAFVQAKGLVSNEKPPSGSITPSHEPPQAGLEGYRKMLSHAAASSRSLSPDLTRRSLTPVSRDSQAPAERHQPPAQNLTSSKPVPAQGNIKVKRQSLSHVDDAQAANSLHSDQFSDNEEPPSANVRKLSQYFPELALAPATS